MHKTDQIMEMFDSQIEVYSNIIHATILKIQKIATCYVKFEFMLWWVSSWSCQINSQTTSEPLEEQPWVPGP